MCVFGGIGSTTFIHVCQSKKPALVLSLEETENRSVNNKPPCVEFERHSFGGYLGLRVKDAVVVAKCPLGDLSGGALRD